MLAVAVRSRCGVRLGIRVLWLGGAAALQFPLAHPAIASDIPGALSVREVTENLALLRQPIPAALWQELRAEGLLPPAAPVPG
jgi:D-threo-aldose 1-dehydrogenase